jgi:hypothetical protein
MNFIVTFSSSVSLIVGAGTVPLNVQVFTLFPGAISISASSATSVISFLVVVLLLLGSLIILPAVLESLLILLLAA